MSASALAQANALPVIVFLKQHDSHIFNDRTIVCNGEIKVGRAVAKLRPAPNNAIFDCKVLSRSHAVIYYDDKKFILRDTNSSNGTFVNNARINKESDSTFGEREIYSGDFIRFGVEVLEGSTNHGCIITQVKLYHSNGAEALPRDIIEPSIESFSHEQLYKLASHVNESIFRERTIQKKVEDLKILLDETREMSKKSWIAMLNEERLLDKLELYENQLGILKANLPEDSLHSKLLDAFEEKSMFEENTKKILEQRLEEKTKALLRVTELENSLADSERETKRLREGLEASQEAYQSVANNLENKLKELESLDKKLTETSDLKGDLESKLQLTTDEYHALKEHLDVSKKSQSSEVSMNKILELQKERDRLRGLLKENDVANKDLNDQALAELEDLDQYINMQDEIIGNTERSLERVLLSTHHKISSSLTNGTKQFYETMRFIRLLQDELSKLENPFIIKTNEVTDESEVSSSANLPINNMHESKSETIQETIGKMKELMNLLAKSHAKTEMSFTNYFDYFNLPEESNHQCREDADGLSDKAADTNEPSISLKDKLDELATCTAATKMSDSQIIDYQNRLAQNAIHGEQEDLMNTSISAYSMVSSLYSGIVDSDDDSTQRSIPIIEEKISSKTLKSKPLNAPLASKDEIEDFDGNVPDETLEYDKDQFNSEQLAFIREKIEDDKLSITSNDIQSPLSQRTSGEGARTRESLKRDYYIMRDKMEQIEKDLSESRVNYIKKLEESSNLRIELQLVEADRDELKTRLENANTQLQNIIQRNEKQDIQTSLDSETNQLRTNTFGSNLTAVAVVPVMILILALMFSIFSQFSK